jgi:hypothetical protein
MGTVRDRLRALWAELRLSPEQAAEAERQLVDQYLSPALPERYRRLAEEVVWRLPDGWDRHAHWYIEVGEREDPLGPGSARRYEEEEDDGGSQHLEVQLYPALLDRLSDAACRWVIAHELVHVASGIPTGSVVIEGIPYTRVKGTVDQYQEALSVTVQEDAADVIALKWGFSEELQAYLAEDV